MIYFLNAIVSRIRAYVIYKQTRAELAQLDDRSLADMGFQRGEIEFLARKAARTA